MKLLYCAWTADYRTTRVNLGIIRDSEVNYWEHLVSNSRLETLEQWENDETPLTDKLCEKFDISIYDTEGDMPVFGIMDIDYI